MSQAFEWNRSCCIEFSQVSQKEGLKIVGRFYHQLSPNVCVLSSWCSMLSADLRMQSMAVTKRREKRDERCSRPQLLVAVVTSALLFLKQLNLHTNSGKDSNRRDSICCCARETKNDIGYLIHQVVLSTIEYTETETEIERH